MSTIFNVNNFYGGNVIISDSGNEWKALIEIFISKQQQRNNRINQLLEVLANAEPEEKQKAISTLHLLQKDNEAYLAAFKQVTNGE
ncbi:hypothetical protein [Dyadobacter frigoris]|uniref:Uncharacterized protein n=1 Tax=Dyadobacter frigoris TaxID=2576211 RepID=A0A4U6CV41_9BACT|nr:hypothetical protein [Dyadobacter frigoris]TKT88609.1 hypothetical protein FDK13_27070 [Dyadobacter frigoris]GLU54942.1 hypothetical protein Dfri01_44030 [Dyadobacter frigoris]